jgi:cation diffusion facilitator CzcD-associated flavoprotein CzcO/pimeloyl-ACP methyl ester carboxylesterase
VIGAGFGGLGVSIALDRAGIDHVIFERAEDVGGTWWVNGYPGCRCDVPSHLYSFSFALNPDWSDTYSERGEIQAYLRHVAERFGVVRRIRFRHEVLEARWDDAAQRWHIETSAGRWTADVLVAATGGLSEPSTPDLPGLERFEGTVFHSGEWDRQHDQTGERVAVIGTGASAVQIVPSIQPKVARLHLFQRTPGWVLPHSGRPIRDWERALYRRLPILQRLVRSGVYWLRELLIFGMVKNPRHMELVRQMAVDHLRRQVPDEALREKLTPTFLPGCKRLLPSNDYYPALTAENVELVTDAIREVRPRSIVTADGVEREVDTIVMATGFRVTNHPVFERVHGRDGRSVTETWRETGAQAYLGTTVAGFPNMFVISGPNTGIGHTSLVVMIEAQLPYIMGALRLMEERGLGAVEVRAEAQAAFNEDLQRRMAGTVWNTGGCASWYLDAQGRNTTLWPDFTWRYRRRMRRFDVAAYLLEPRRSADERIVVADDGVALHAEVAGDRSAPVTVVLSHGWCLSGASWDAQVAALSETARVVRYDQRGHGGSGWRTGAMPTIDRLGEDLRAVLDQLAPEGRVVLAGHSTGGMTIMALAAAHPELFADRVAGVGLVSTSSGLLREVTLGLPRPLAALTRRLLPLLMSSAAGRPGPAERLRRRRVERLIARSLFGRAAAPDAVAAAAELVHGTPMEVIGAFYAALMAHDKRDALAALRDVPTLIAVGELDRLTPVSHARTLAGALPDARLVVVPGCGHMLPMERPEALNEELRELLARATAPRAAAGV